MARRFTENALQDMFSIAENQSLCVSVIRRRILISPDDEEGKYENRIVLHVSPSKEFHGPCVQLPLDPSHTYSNITDKRPIHHWITTFCSLLLSFDCEVFIRVDQDTVEIFDPLNPPVNLHVFTTEDIADMLLPPIQPLLVVKEKD